MATKRRKTKSRRRKSRRKSCKYGKLKRKVKTKSGRKRRCKKKSRKRKSRKKSRKRRFKIGELPSYENIPPPQYIDPEIEIMRDRNNNLSNLLEDTQRDCDRRIARLNHNVEVLQHNIVLDQIEIQRLERELENEEGGEIVPFNPPQAQAQAPQLSELITDPNIGDPTNLQSFEFDVGLYEDVATVVIPVRIIKMIIDTLNVRPFLSDYSRCAKLLMLWCLDNIVMSLNDERRLNDGSLVSQTEFWNWMTANNFSNLKNVLDQCSDILNHFKENEDDHQPRFVDVGPEPVEIDIDIIEMFCEL